ncbi:sensor histidine kinase [Anatilimnocola floriformis]|uniref:sensor histidine kinase n=1 Tax=Anatilimnocola floriformis TaxID=2948575 RepID=UPI0020C2468D|nr:two-component regulator propeller domain-containing protein [Anatilimnocola floriformis]
MSSNRWLLAAGLLVLGTVFFSTAAHGLDPQRPLSQALLRIWQTPQGLPRVVIYSIFQTKDGYLWLGTQAGLFRFDGVRFVPMFADHEQLAKCWIRDLCEDNDQNLWIATEDAGLIRWRAGRVTSFGQAEGLPSNHVRCLQVDRRGDLWIGTDRGLACLRDGKVAAVNQENLRSLPIHALDEAADGTLWIATAGPAVWTSNGTAFTKQSFKALPAESTINAIHAGPGDTVWLGTSAGLLRRSGETERLFTVAGGLGSDEVLCLATAREAGLWIGTKDGYCRVQGDRLESFQSRDGLSQSTALALCEDHEGSLWVGTKYGLNQFVDRRTLLPFTTSEGLPSNDTGPVLQTEQGDIWVGTLDAGLAKFAGREFALAATLQAELPSQRILSLAGDAGDLWIGTDAGLCREHAGQIVEQFTTAEGLPANKILALCRDQAGALWIGTSGGIVKLHAGKLVKPPGLDMTRPIQALVAHPGGYLIAAVEGGELYRIADGEVTLFDEQLTGWRDVVAFHVDAQRHLWVAFRDGGLGLIDGDKHFRFRAKDGLYDDDIVGIASDDRGRLWVACSRGIFSVLAEELQQFSAGRISQINCTPFSPTDASRTIECRRGVQPAVWKMEDGRIWFSTIRGILVVDPQRSTRTLPPPSVVIEEINVNGQSTSAKQLATLPPGRTNFDFHYTALSFASPTRITFRYQLAGFDADWINAGSRREAFYTNLAPGSYRFRVLALNSDGVETESTPLEFTVRPHFYETWAFLLCVVFAIVAAAWIAFRLRMQRVKERLQVVLGERNRIARELHDTLIQGFSGVTMQMQALAARLKKPDDLATLSEIISDAGNCLSEARRSVAGLRNPENAESGLTAAITQSARQLTEGSDLRLQLQLGPLAGKFNPDVEYNVLRIVQEAISNTIKHAQASAVEVRLKSNAHEVAITVHDDGQGFDVARHLEQAQPGHYGLIGMRERASQIGATVQWRSQPRQGTTVLLSLPLSSAAALKR